MKKEKVFQRGCETKVITLSVNPTIIKSKEDGDRITSFGVRSFDLDQPGVEEELRNLCSTSVHAVNHWSGGVTKAQKAAGLTGKCEKKNYQGVFGLALDYDDGHVSLSDACTMFKDYIHIIYTSSGHRQDKPDHNGIQDRFRVILPYRPTFDGSALFGGKLSGKKYYEYLKATFPEADPKVFNMHMKLYPFAGPDPDLYEFYLKTCGKWYSITLDDINSWEESNSAKKEKKKVTTNTFRLDDEITLPDRKSTMLVGDVEEKQVCFCNFCDDLNSQSASAFVSLNDHGEYYMYCSHCDKTYWSDQPRFKSSMMDLYFDHRAGYVAYFDKEEREPKFFKNKSDWINFCRTAVLNPAVDTRLPRAKTIFNPKFKHGLENGEFNTFTPSEYLKVYNPKIKPDLNILRSKTPRIMSILENLFGDDNSINLFLNWVGYILQERRKTTLAWIITTEARGTGKEVLMSLILAPIFGYKQAQIEAASGMNDKFNALDMTCWIRTYDEVFQKAAFTTNIERREWLKTRIGSKSIIVEFKGIDKMMMESHMNFVLLSNYSDSILLEKGDRRFNVMRNENAVPLHTMDWWTTGKDMEREIESELEVFAEYLQRIEIDANRANYPTENEARRHMLESSKEDMELIADALRNGDVDFFELDEAFPQRDADELMGPHYDGRLICQIAIENHHAIPSKWMKRILGRFFRNMSILNMRRKLGSFGAKADSIKLEGKTYRVWAA